MDRMSEGLRWYQLVYRLLYRLGLVVWRREMPAADLVAMIEGPSRLAPGRALDLGCGTGTDTIYLATHGWDVTAVDMVPRAPATARRNATAAGMRRGSSKATSPNCTISRSATAMRLLLDFGCFHTLPDDRRAAYVASVSGAAAAGGKLLLYGFRRPPKAAPMHAGVTTDEVTNRFSGAGWELVNAERTSAEIPRARRADDRFELWRYQLRRVAA
jgi:SAM-dependent methyltransferase